MSSSPAIIDSDAAVWPLHGAVIKSQVYVQMYAGKLVAVNIWRFQISACNRWNERLIPVMLCLETNEKRHIKFSKEASFCFVC